MPALGEIRQGHEVGYKTIAKRIWHACEICGKERWVSFIKGKPKVKWCANCSRIMAAQLRRSYCGSQNPHWNGGIYHGEGYIFLRQPEHPQANCYGYVKRARLVLEQKLGRYLLEGCEPHHRNEIKDDDRPENLEEREHGQHMQMHASMRTHIQPNLRIVLKLARQYLSQGFKRPEAMQKAWAYIRSQ